MVKRITLTHNEKFSCEYLEDQKLIQKSKPALVHSFDVKNNSCLIQIKINPWKIKPLVRFDGHLVNYGLAKITPWDHMLEFRLYEDHVERYFKSIIDAKEKYLSRTGQNIPTNMDSYVGVNNSHNEIVSEIKALIK
jgi:hypothetical protein